MRMQPAESRIRPRPLLHPREAAPSDTSPLRGPRVREQVRSGEQFRVRTPHKSGSLEFRGEGPQTCLGRDGWWEVPRTCQTPQSTKNTEERPKPAGEGRDSACNTASTTHPVPRRGKALQIRPRVRGDYPPNLSILLSGGKETNRDSPSKCDRTGRSPACSLEPPFPGARGMPRSGGSPSRVPAQLSPLERGHYPWRVRGPYALPPGPWNGPSVESGCLKLQPKAGGKLHLRLNTTTSPIANKYREGKLKRTLKREFKSA